MAAATQTRFEAGKMTRCSSVCESLRESTDDTPSTQALSNTPPASCYPTMPFYTPMPMMNLPEPAAMMFPSAFDLCMSGDGFATQGFAADMGFSPLTPQQQIAAGVCQSCQMKPVALGTFFCSKRCSWFFEGRCAQCGRTRENHYIYCSGSCANQAAQANWCPTCAVRQVLCGTTSCGVMTCISHHQSAPVRQLRVKKHLRVPPTCEIMGPHDKLRETVFSQFSPALQSGVATSVLAIIKINGDNNRRKSYLNHRAFVETNIAQRNVMKYGYGGEGNEQRRFFAMHMKCKLGFNGMVEPCTPEDPNQCCDVCSVLQHGFQLRRMQCASHYCTSSPVNAASYAACNPDGVKAVILSRVVVGSPEIISVDPMHYQPPVISLPTDPINVHSTIVSNGNPADDGTYVFRDDAVDAQFIVLFQ